MHPYRALVSFAAVLVFGACQTDDADDPALVLRDSVPAIDMHAPTAADAVVATLLPGKPFLFAGRYWIASGPGVNPDMTRFTPAHVGSIPTILAGDTVSVVHGAQLSRARLIMSEVGAPMVFVPQSNSPFLHSFARVPWSAWNGHANQVSSCATQVDDEQADCVAEVDGDYTACQDAAVTELGECASNQNYSVSPALGVNTPLQFECLLPGGSVTGVVDASINYLGCDCSFSGTITYQPGDDGCEQIYDGTISDCGPPCNDDFVTGEWEVEGPLT